MEGKRGDLKLYDPTSASLALNSIRPRRLFRSYHYQHARDSSKTALLDPRSGDTVLGALMEKGKKAMAFVSMKINAARASCRTVIQARQRSTIKGNTRIQYLLACNDPLDDTLRLAAPSPTHIHRHLGHSPLSESCSQGHPVTPLLKAQRDTHIINIYWCAFGPSCACTLNSEGPPIARIPRMGRLSWARLELGVRLSDRTAEVIAMS